MNYIKQINLNKIVLPAKGYFKALYSITLYNFTLHG